MKSLFLSGGGNKEQTEKIDRVFVREISKKKPLLYIPIAMEPVQYEACLRWINSVFNPLGIHNIVMWTEIDGKTVESLQAFSAVYIGGGNTFKLLDDVKRTRFDQVLTSYYESGGIIYGGSAGAILLGADIATCSHLDQNKVGLTALDALDLVQGYSVWCHYQKEEDSLVEEYLKHSQNPVIALPEGTALFFTKGKRSVLGEDAAFIFENKKKKEVCAGEYID